MKRGQVYLLRLDPTEASEEAGTRPAVIVFRNAINQYSPVVVICPMTDAAHVPKPYPSDVFVKAPEGMNDSMREYNSSLFIQWGILNFECSILNYT